VRAAFEINVIAPFAMSSALIPRMVHAGWGRIINISSSVAGRTASMIGANAYVSTKAALEAHSGNLAAELDGTGVTVNVYRPGGVDTDMQRWIRSQSPERIGAGLRDRFAGRYEAGELISAQESAAHLLDHLLGADSNLTGAIWDLGDTVAL
jgi:NAD(P)-dependent dehydrogenase (short-subunit alcohol dehydrogenase family)